MVMNIKHMNSNLKSLLQHAAIMSSIKSGIYSEDEFGISIVDHNSSDINCYVHIPPKSDEIPASYVKPCRSLHNDPLITNIKSLSYHYIKYFNLPNPDELIIFSGSIYYKMSSVNSRIYCISKIIHISMLCNMLYYYSLYNYYKIT